MSVIRVISTKFVSIEGPRFDSPASDACDAHAPTDVYRSVRYPGPCGDGVETECIKIENSASDGYAKSTAWLPAQPAAYSKRSPSTN